MFCIIATWVFHQKCTSPSEPNKTIFSQNINPPFFRKHSKPIVNQPSQQKQSHLPVRVLPPSPLRPGRPEIRPQATARRGAEGSFAEPRQAHAIPRLLRLRRGQPRLEASGTGAAERNAADRTRAASLQPLSCPARDRLVPEPFG